MLTITPGSIHAALIQVLKPSEIDHHASDLYCKVTPESRTLVSQLPQIGLIETFRDQTTGELWFDIPFCYNPEVAATHAAKEA